MTRPSKKEHERRLANRFLEDCPHTSLEENECPDFRVRRPEGDFALEVTEYHAQATANGTCKPRVQVEASWWRDIEPKVNSRRQDKQLKHVKAHLRFADRHLPQKTQGDAVAVALVNAVAAAVKDRRFNGTNAEVEFASRALIESFGDFKDGAVFLPQEVWPDIALRLDSLTVMSHNFEWPSWDCQNASTSWVAPDVEAFRRILHDKARKSRMYTLNGIPLWLLIVCDAIEDGGDSHGDLASHIFPRTEAEADQLRDILQQTGFDFQTSQFAEVWLFSNFGKQRLQLHPWPT